MPLAVVAATVEVLAHPECGEELLTPEEQARAGAFRRDADRADFVAAHTLVRLCAARFLGVSPGSLTLVQRCPDCGGPHGRPEVAGYPELCVSMTHTPGVVMAAAAWDQVGVDAERYSGETQEVPAHVLAPGELASIRSSRTPRLAFVRQWVRKEALIKVGAASLSTLRAVDLSALPVPGEATPGTAVPYGPWWLVDWLDHRRHAAGAVVARSRAPHLVEGLAAEPFATSATV